MFGKSKKIVSVAYKEKLLAEIAHYEKRIEEALNKHRQNSFEDESFEDITNPYKFKLQPSQYELKQQEASLSDRASMTLELAMLTVMQSEVNVMITAPEVRRPVLEDGVWHEVAAECKIDLVSFTITFYAHKPHRRFAPIRYRKLCVALVKPAHQKELSQSILPKLQLPNLALQVLQSYAAAFRSRRTTLLELAERYTDKLQMQAMPDGGYRVRFLDLLQVDWTLENLWSPIVPFCHRMKFEVEYMPKDYISAIGKLYKQFKDPSLETSERTAVLARIFDTCLQAAGPARELMDSFESDPETAGRLHERRTTIDQEPDVPHVEHSPKKPSGKENKPQNRKTDMAPPKTIPKKAKKNKSNHNNMSENRKSVKRAIESDTSNAKRPKSHDDDDDNSKSKAGLKGGSSVKDRDEMDVGLEDNNKKRDKNINPDKDSAEDNGQKKSSSKITAKNAKEPVVATVGTENDLHRKGEGNKNKTNNDIVRDKNKNNEANSKDSSEASSKVSKNTNKSVKSKDTENNKGNTKKVNEKSEKNNDKTASKNTANQKENVAEKEVSVSKDAENKEHNQNDKVAIKNTGKSKDKNKEKDDLSSKEPKSINSTQDNKKLGNSKKNNVNDGLKLGTNNDEGTLKKKKSTIEVVIAKRSTYTKDVTNEKADNTKTAKDTETSRASSKTVATNDFGKDKSTKEVSKLQKNVAKIVEKVTVDNKSEKSKTDVKKNKETAAKANVNNENNLKVNNGVTNDTKAPSKVVNKNKISNKPIDNAKNLNERKAEKRKITSKTEQKENSKTTVDKTFTVTEQTQFNEVTAKKLKTTDKNPVNKNTAKIKTNNIKLVNQRSEKESKINQNNKIKNNNLNKTITKPIIMPISEQTKKATLKTRIPMMKRLTFVGNKLDVRRSQEKMALKSLPLKRLANPVRMSPRKLPIFKPSAHGYSNK